MASAFSKLRKNSKLGSAWKKARKAEGFKQIQSKVGDYAGKLKIDSGIIEKGTYEGVPFIRFVCTVVEPDECAGQSNTKDYLFGDDPDKTLETLARDMKFMFPASKDEIAKATFEELLQMLEDLADDTHDVLFSIQQYTPKAGKNKGNPQLALNIGAVEIAEGGDDDDEDEEDEDEEDEAPAKKSKSKTKPKSKKADDEDEDDDDDDNEDDDDDDSEEEESDDDEDDEEEEYVPSKGDTVKYGRSTFKVTALQTKAETATLKNVKNANISKGIAWSKLTPVDDEDE